MAKKYTLESLLEKYNVRIPQIQRDYAQGRTDKMTSRIRRNFLDTLYTAVMEKPVTLDFVYGQIEDDGSLVLLDGQQRITTLFLLYWYAFVNDGNEHEQEMTIKDVGLMNHSQEENTSRKKERDFPFCKFTYETRYSSRRFLECLVKFTPLFPADKLSLQIENQPWFSVSWKLDPTISSMLVMIDAINEKFFAVENLWERLCSETISFYFLELKEMGLSDELYVRMNSRGRPLTRFEHYKADLEKRLTLVDSDLAKEIARRFDGIWTDFLWRNRPTDKSASLEFVDRAFMNIFGFVCDVICYTRGQSNNGRSHDEFVMLDRFFTVSDMTKADNIIENAHILKSIFDCWCSVPTNLAEYAQSFISDDGHAKGKIRDRGKKNFFMSWLTGYLDSEGEVRNFSFGDFVILYAFTVFLQQEGSVAEADFRHRLRVVSNLVDNSENELSDSEDRAGGNRMPAILRQVESIIRNGVILEGQNDFNTIQCQEEAKKLEWTKVYPSLAESLFQLEDHRLLHGQIGIVGLENAECFNRFESLFSCNWDKVDCALMSTGDYHQREHNGWRCQFGSSRVDSGFAWDYLFHRRMEKADNNEEGFEKTKNILVALLKSHESFSNDLLDGITAAYIVECERTHHYDFRYYYVKYGAFRPGSYGKCWMRIGCHFDIVMMLTRSNISPSSYHPFLKEISVSFPEMENGNDGDQWYLIVNGKKFTCEEDGLKENGITIEGIKTVDSVDDCDRIEVGRAWVARQLVATGG